MAEIDVLADWAAGKVEHIQPTRPTANRAWPVVSAGPQRLESLLTMWIDGLPNSMKMALHRFLFHVLHSFLDKS